MKDRRTTGTEETQHQHHLLGPALHHLREQRDAIKVDEFLGEGDVPGRVSQVFQGLQLSVHAGRLDPLMELDRSLVLGEEACVISRPRGGGVENIFTCRLTHRRGGQTQDGAILDVVAILRRI